MNGRTTLTRLGAALALTALPLAACGSSDGGATPPTADELAASLLTTGDLDGRWTVNAGPAEFGGGSGVVTEEQQQNLPRFGVCDEQGSADQESDENLHWFAFRQLDLTSDDPIDLPGDRTGHMAFVQEYLTAGDPADLQATFELLRDGAAACYGDIPAGAEGPGTAGPLTIPDLGDDRFGAQMTLAEAGGWAEWRLSYAVVRDGPVLLSVVVTDIAAGTDHLWSTDDLADMVRAAAAKI
jgi:hypothetical protein